ncbi:unnamed protein product [Cladocopium goreaui]|uniref:Uncharacterized protein n=1 Tax=Cladocopium goreaui TaxID=2562237 RepID=A0A9P1FZE3_9DINO|nr:unnamed protein product [Cladocopium goreaui]
MATSSRAMTTFRTFEEASPSAHLHFHQVIQQQMEDFNRRHHGLCFIFRSNSTSHFMNAEAFLTLLHGLITPGLAVHRRRLGLPPTAKALLLVDAWTGFHAFKHGEDCARSAWAVQACCELPKQQACFTTNERRIFHMDAGGFSANGQPIDQVHHLLRSQLEVLDAEDVGYGMDLRLRPGYDQLAINPNGQPVRPSACNKQTLCERTLAAWQKVPRKAFVAAWTATGYFNNDHFEEGLGMSYEEALRELDQTGLLASVGIRDDYIGCPKVPDRWYWSLKMEDGRIAALPSLISRSVETLICSHRRERKVLLTAKPANWEQKLEAVNAKTSSFVYDLKQNALATSQYLKRSVTKVDDKLEFIGKGRGYEILHIKFQLNDDATDPSGPGTYSLYSKSFAAREICCVSTTQQRSGFDILKEHYAGRVCSNHRKV